MRSLVERIGVFSGAVCSGYISHSEAFTMRQHSPPSISKTFQTSVSVGVILLALGLAFGALSIPSDAGYAGVGPNFLPWLVAVALFVCGLIMLYKARNGGFRNMDESTGEKPYWPGFIWMSGGLLVNAALITTIGFIFSCTLCFAMASRGLRNAEGRPNQGIRTWLTDLAIGLTISAPVYWMFTKFLAINLPGLTSTGWL
jgi:putative tricarboxylic transport membrane protein